MLDFSANAVTAVLSQSFEWVVGLHDSINMNEHKNESICFVGIDGYKLSEPIFSGSGVTWSSRVRYLIKVLAKRTMSAQALCSLIDDTVIPALSSVAGVSEISRGEAVYIREQGRYCVSCELVFATAPPPAAAGIVALTVGTVAYSCMNAFEISNVVKTGETPTLNNGIRTRIIGVRPSTVTVKGEGASGVIGAAYTSLSPSLGSVITGGISVGGIAFTGVAMTELKLDTGADGKAKITVVFTEVNET